jgi:hypothetical protein
MSSLVDSQFIPNSFSMHHLRCLLSDSVIKRTNYEAGRSASLLARRHDGTGGLNRRQQSDTSFVCAASLWQTLHKFVVTKHAASSAVMITCKDLWHILTVSVLAIWIACC